MSGDKKLTASVCMSPADRSGSVIREDLKTLLSHMPVFVVKAIGKEEFGEADTEVRGRPRGVDAACLDRVNESCSDLRLSPIVERAASC